MTVVSFAADSVVTGLVDALRLTAGFCDPAAQDGTDVPVYDGAIVSDDRAHSCVVVGADGDTGGVQRPFRFTSEWHDLDMTTDEQGQIQCAVVVWSGDANADTYADQRSTAVEILQDVDQALRASISAAQLGVTSLLWSKVDAAELIQSATARGTETRLPFTYGYRALLQVT